MNEPVNPAKTKTLHLASLQHCNQACLFCAKAGGDPRSSFIPTAVARKMLRDQRQSKADRVIFDGGEPTLRPDLANLLRYSFRCGYRSVEIVSNGVLLSDVKRVKQLTAIPDHRAERLSFCISLHSHIASISDALTRRPGTFHQTLQGLRNLIAEKIPVSLYCVITKSNYRHLPDYAGFIHANLPEIRQITFSFIYPSGAALQHMRIYPKVSEVRPYLIKALATCRTCGIQASLGSCGILPFCMAQGLEDLLLQCFRHDSPGKVNINDRSRIAPFFLATPFDYQGTKIKSSRCPRCRLDDYCGGIWKVYAKKFGLEELRPFYKTTTETNRWRDELAAIPVV